MLSQKLNKLKTILRKMGPALLAYSGGVDSVFLAAVCRQVLKEKFLAVTADSPTYSAEELRFARKIAKQLGIEHLVIGTKELEDRRFFSNPPDRCYYCKRELFSLLRRLADSRGILQLIDASNISDKSDYRPGNKAKGEFRVRSPLQEAGFDKADIRLASRAMGLISWNKPAMACLATRIPYGTPVSREILCRVNQAEQALIRMGFSMVRIRHYGDRCSLETDIKQFPLVILKRRKILAALKRAGYDHVGLDLQGYRQGSLNLGIPAAQIKKHSK